MVIAVCSASLRECEAHAERWFGTHACFEIQVKAVLHFGTFRLIVRAVLSQQGVCAHVFLGVLADSADPKCRLSACAAPGALAPPARPRSA